MTVDQRNEIAIESTRRRYTNDLLQALGVVANSQFSGPNPAPVRAAGIGMDTKIQDFGSNFPFAKLASFIDFIKANQLVLAIPTMHFPMAAHVFYAHVTRLGHQIKWEDFRQFLQEVHDGNFLFV
jgi:hypothetical protein